VREAVKSRVEAGWRQAGTWTASHRYLPTAGRLQHLIWHEGYHHGQIKLALKLAGRAVSDKEAGPVTW